MDYYLSSTLYHQYHHQYHENCYLNFNNANKHDDNDNYQTECTSSRVNNNTSSNSTGSSSSSSIDVSLLSSSSSSLLSSWPGSYFSEQLVLLDSLGFYFERPILQAVFDTAVSESSRVTSALPLPTHISSGSVSSNTNSNINNDKITANAEYRNALIMRPNHYYKTILKELLKGKTSNNNNRKTAGVAGISIGQGAKEIAQLIKRKLHYNISIALCPQHLPKFHPDFDVVITNLMLQPTISSSANNTVNNNSISDSGVALVLLSHSRKKLQWQRTLMQRWQVALSVLLQQRATSSSSSTVLTDASCESNLANSNNNNNTNTISNARCYDTAAARILQQRIVWITSPLSPAEYLILLSIGDVMLDPWPFGGGVTTLESLAVCTPVLTLPTRQTVPQLAAGMLHSLLKDTNSYSMNKANSNSSGYSSDINDVEFKVTNEFIMRDEEHYIQQMNTLLSLPRVVTGAAGTALPSYTTTTTTASAVIAEDVDGGKHAPLQLIQQLRSRLCHNELFNVEESDGGGNRLYNQRSSVEDWGNFIYNAGRLL